MSKSKKSKYQPKTKVHITEFTQDGNTYKKVVSSDYEDAELDYSVNFPGYKRALALGTPATTARSGIKEELSADEWTTTNTYKAGPFSSPVIRRSRGTDAIPGNVHARFRSYDSSVSSAASAKFLAACADASHNFDGGQFFGEFMKTVQLVSSPLKGIVNAAKSHRSRVVGGLRGRTYASLNRKQKDELQTRVYDSYLEFTFGVKPLMSDIDSALDTAIEAQRKVIRVVCHGEASSSIQVVDQTELAAADENLSFADVFRTTTAKATFSCRVVGAIVILNGNNPVENFAKNSGGGLDNFLPTVYNLIPGSFLLDYVSNAGDIIQATSAYRLNHAWSNTTDRIEIEAQSKLTSRASGTLPVGATNSYSVSGGSIRLKSDRWKRQGGYPVVDINSFQFKLPDAHQLLNTAALIGSLFGSRSIN